MRDARDRPQRQEAVARRRRSEYDVGRSHFPLRGSSASPTVPPMNRQRLLFTVRVAVPVRQADLGHAVGKALDPSVLRTTWLRSAIDKYGQCRSRLYGQREPRRSNASAITVNRRLISSTDPETGVASGMPEAAMCVQDVDVQCVLQFTLLHAAGCALHRHTSRVIHRLELYHLLPVWAAPHRPTLSTQDDVGGLRRPAGVGIATVHKSQQKHGFGATIGRSLNLRQAGGRSHQPAHRASDKYGQCRTRDRYPEVSTSMHSFGPPAGTAGFLRPGGQRSLVVDDGRRRAS